MNNKYKIAILCLIILVSSLSLLKLSKINKKNINMISTITLTNNSPLPIGIDTNGVYTISGKTGFFGFNNPSITPSIDYNDSNYTDTRLKDTDDKRSLIIDKTRTMPMTLSWVFLNPTISQNTENFTIPITNLDETRKHYNYEFIRNPSDGNLLTISLSETITPNPCYVEYNISSNKDGPIIPPLEKPLNCITFMMMFHLWMLKRYDIDTIKNELFYNSIVGDAIYDIIDKVDDPQYPESFDVMRLKAVKVIGADDYYSYGIKRSKSPIADDIRTQVPTGYINWQLANPYDNNSNFNVLKGIDGPTFDYKGGASGVNQTFYLTYGGGYSYRQIGNGFSMTQPFYQTNTNIIQNNVNTNWIEMNSFSGKKNDFIWYLDDSKNYGGFGFVYGKQYNLWINPFFSPNAYVKEFIAQDPYLQFLFFTDPFFQPDSNSSVINTITSSNNVDGYLKQFILDLYRPAGSTVFYYGINWMKNEFCNANSGFLYEDSGTYCACQDGYKHTNETELAIDDLYKLVKGSNQDRRCAFSKCKNISAYQPISQVSCSSFCGVINIDHAEEGSVIQNNGTYNISCGEGSKSYNYICSQECTNSGGTCPSNSSDTNITSPTCICPSGKKSIIKNGIAQCEADTQPLLCGKECTNSGGTCYNSSCICPVGTHTISKNGIFECEKDIPTPPPQPPTPSSSKTGLIVISIIGSISIIGIIALIVFLYKRIGKKK